MSTLSWISGLAYERSKRQYAQAVKRLEEMRNRPVVIGVDLGAPGGDYSVEFEAQRQADGTFEIKDIRSWKKTIDL